MEIKKNELEENQTIEKYIIALNEKYITNWQLHLKQFHVYFHVDYPNIPYVIVKPRDYFSSSQLVDKRFDVQGITNDLSGNSERKRLKKTFDRLVNKQQKIWYGWQYFTLNDLNTSVNDFYTFSQSSPNIENIVIKHQKRNINIEIYVNFLLDEYKSQNRY